MMVAAEVKFPLPDSAKESRNVGRVVTKMARESTVVAT